VVFLVTTSGTLEASEMKFADLPGVRLAYFDTGGMGEPVILVHALAGTSESWAPQIKSFADAGYRVIAYDRRGWGKSVPMPATGAQPGISDVDLDGLVTRIGLDKFHLVAIAGGSFVAMDYASLHQDKLASLTLAASTGMITDDKIKDFSKRIRNPDVKWPSVYLEIGLSYMGSNPEGVAKWMKIHKHARQKGASYQPRNSPNTLAKLETIRVPTLVVAGGADQLSPPALMKRWAAHIKNHEYAIVPEAGHSINWEYPEEFDNIVLPFLKAHSID